MRLFKIAFYMILAANWLSIYWLTDVFAHSPRAARGAYEVPYDMHGTIIYISQLQHDAYYGAWVLVFALMVVGAIVHMVAAHAAEKKAIQNELER